MRFGILFAAALGAVGFGAAPVVGDGALDAAARSRAVEGVARLVEETYVFPEVGKEMARAVREKGSGKTFEGLDGPGLARALTRELRGVSRDRHLRVEYSAETLPPEPKGNPLLPAPEQMEAMRVQLARDNFGFKKVEVLDGNIGYLRIDLFTPPEFAADTYTAAMNFVAQTDALIIDLRYNGGSIHPDAVPLLCSYFFDKPVHLNDLYWRPQNRTDEYWTKEKVAGKKYLGKPIYLLTSRRTFSGAEEFAYDLKNLKRATLIGDTTGGGANGGGDRRVDDHFSIWVPVGRAINPITKTNWEGTGVAPDVAVPAVKALVTARITALRGLLAGATDPRLKEALDSAIAGAERDASRFKAVTFTLKGRPEAKEVFVAGTFNGWSERANPLKRQGDDWIGQVELEPGKQAYKFVVDGEWILDPSHRETEKDGPNTNSIRVVD